MATEAGSKLCDQPPVVQLVECVPDAAPQVLSVDVSAVIQESPVQQAMMATIEQTGADPPPAGVR